MGNDITPFGGNNGIVPYGGDGGGVAPYHGGGSAGHSGAVTGSSQDVALFESFGQALSANGLNGVHQHRAMQAAQRWYAQTMQQVDAQEAAMHDRQQNHALSELRREWGADYPTNMRLLHGFVNSLPAETKEFLLESRRDDRAALLNHVPFLRRMVDLLRAERINDGHGLSAPSRGQQPEQVTAGTETLEEIDAMIADRKSKYFRGPAGERARLERRYRDLLDQKHGWSDE